MPMLERREFVGAMLALFCGVAMPQVRENVWIKTPDHIWVYLGTKTSAYRHSSTRITWDGTTSATHAMTVTSLICFR
jgi:hypothetical protein